MIKSKNNFFKTSDNVYIYFEDYGKGDPIVILHGFLCSSKFFGKNIEELSKNNRLILVDWRGHGSSSKTTNNLTMERCGQDIKELFDYLDLENITLLGWSMGSSVVLDYFEQFNSYRLKAIGIIDSFLYPFSPENWNTHALKNYNMDGFSNLVTTAGSDYNGYCCNFAHKIFKSEPSKEDEAWVVAEMKKVPTWIAFTLYNDFIFNDYTDTLRKINIPLLLCGANSPIIPNGIEIMEHYRNLIDKKCMYYAFEEGHIMFYENPEVFNKIILNFVNIYSIKK